MDIYSEASKGVACKTAGRTLNAITVSHNLIGLSFSLQCLNHGSSHMAVL
jgi:hypothetical protein